MRYFLVLIQGLILVLSASSICAQPADLILHNGKIVTVNDQFTVADAVAVRDGAITVVGDNQRVLRERGSSTRIIDLNGKMVLPGLIDSHVHPTGASMTEWDHPIPDMESIADSGMSGFSAVAAFFKRSWRMTSRLSVRPEPSLRSVGSAVKQFRVS